MADDKSGKSIADAYRVWTDDTTVAAPPPPSDGASIADAYRTPVDAAAPITKPSVWDLNPNQGELDAMAAQGPSAARWLGAVDKGFREGAAAGTDIQGQPILTGLMRQGGGLLGATTAGLAQGAVEMFGERGGRDALGWLAALLGPDAAIYPRGMGKAPEVNQLQPRTVMERAAPPPIEGQSTLGRINALIRHDEQWNNPAAPGYAPPGAPPGPGFMPPGATPPVTGLTMMGVPDPSLVNALDLNATPPAGTRAGVTPPVSPTSAPSARIAPIITQAQAEAEADRILRHFAGDQTPVINSAPLASGAQPTLSQSIEGGHGGLAGLERGVRDVPEQTQHFVTRETGNTTVRNKAVGDVIGDSRATDVVEAQLNARTAPQEKAIFDPARTKPVDPSDAIAGIDRVLNGPQGERDVVKASLQHIRDKLVDKDGNLKTDPALLRGVDLSIGDMIGPKAAGTAHDGRMAAHQLMEVRANLRDAIEQGAPGYQDFLAQQAAERSAIDGQRFLQARNILDRNGNVNLGTLDATIKAAETQQRLPGARLADGVTDEQLARLKELRVDYQNDAKQRLGTSLGSPTVQKFGVSGSMGVMGHPLLAGAVGTGGALAAGVNPVLGMALGGVSYLLKGQSLKGQRMVMDALRDKLLNPEKARSAFERPP